MKDTNREQKKCFLKSDFIIDLIHYNEHKLTNGFINSLTSNSCFPYIIRPFQERCVIACAYIHTYTKMFKSVINGTCKSNFWPRIFTTCFLSDQDICLYTLLLNRQSCHWLLNLSSWRFWFWKLLILHRNQKAFLLSSVYKHLKGVFAYTRKEKSTKLKKTSNL